MMPSDRTMQHSVQSNTQADALSPLMVGRWLPCQRRAENRKMPQTLRCKSIVAFHESHRLQAFSTDPMPFRARFSALWPPLASCRRAGVEPCRWADDLPAELSVYMVGAVSRELPACTPGPATQPLGRGDRSRITCHETRDRRGLVGRPLARQPSPQPATAGCEAARVVSGRRQVRGGEHESCNRPGAGARHRVLRGDDVGRRRSPRPG